MEEQFALLVELDSCLFFDNFFFAASNITNILLHVLQRDCFFHISF